MFLFTLAAIRVHASEKDWAVAIPPDQKGALNARLMDFVKYQRSRDWNKLFDYVSAAGLGGVDRKTFVVRMNGAHGRQFANDPDLLEFKPDRVVHCEGCKKPEYDVLGCGSARREGRNFHGVAVVHAVLENDSWFFSGWMFTEFPNEPCSELSDSRWKAPNAVEWTQPMEELRGVGVPFHIDKPKN